MPLRPLSTYFPLPFTKTSKNWEDIKEEDFSKAVVTKTGTGASELKNAYTVKIAVGADMYKARGPFNQSWSGVKWLYRRGLQVRRLVTKPLAALGRKIFSGQATNSAYLRTIKHNADRKAERAHDAWVANSMKTVFENNGNLDDKTRAKIKEDLIKIYNQETFQSGRWRKKVLSGTDKTPAQAMVDRTKWSLEKAALSIHDKISNDPDVQTQGLFVERYTSELRGIMNEAGEEAFRGDVPDLDNRLDNPLGNPLGNKSIHLFDDDTVDGGGTASMQKPESIGDDASAYTKAKSDINSHYIRMREKGSLPVDLVKLKNHHNLADYVSLNTISLDKKLNKDVDKVYSMLGNIQFDKAGTPSPGEAEAKWENTQPDQISAKIADVLDDINNARERASLDDDENSLKVLLKMKTDFDTLKAMVDQYSDQLTEIMEDEDE